ncbi:hypothetical protein ES705_07281 [subsurface metagenome]
MTVRWQIRVKDTSGVLVAVLDDTGGFSQASVSQDVNDVKTATVEFSAEDDRKDFFVLDGLVEFWRSNKDWGVWYREFVGLFREPVIEEVEDGNPRFRAHIVGPLDLVRRRVIAYKDEESPEVTKSDVGETVMKEYVDENAGSLATTGNGRERTGTITGLSIETDLSRGSSWTGGRSFENLLTVLKELAVATELDFEIDMDVNPSTFTFKVHPLLGTDRSKEGLDIATGLNGAGNVPMVFSREMGTLRHPVRAQTRKQEVNVGIVLGKGEGASRTVFVEEDTELTDDSPWNDIESVINAGNEEDVDLQGRALTYLAERAPVEAVSFDLVQTREMFYGEHYFLGDLVAIEFLGLDLKMKIVSADLSMQDGKEMVSFRFREVS